MNATPWTRAGSPHFVVGPITGVVVIEAGATVCVQRNVSISLTSLIARGTATAPIVFLPIDTAVTWSGIVVPFGNEASIVDLEHVHFKRTSGSAIQLQHGTLKHVVIDSACSSSAGCFAVNVESYGAVTLVQPIIRASGGGGIHSQRRSTIRIDGGSILGSAGTGIAVGLDDAGTPNVVLDSPVRITGGKGIPAAVPAATAAYMTRDSATTAFITGNAHDMLVVLMATPWGSTSWAPADATIRREMPWRMRLGCGGSFPKVTLAAGASLTLQEASCRSVSTRLYANATAAEPAVVNGNGGYLVSQRDDTAFVRHVHFRDVQLRLGGGPTILENIVFTRSQLHLAAPGSRIIDSSVSGAAASPVWDLVGVLPGTLTLEANTELLRTTVHQTSKHGVAINGPGVRLSACAITNNAGDGVRVMQGGGTITNCNFEANSGAGVTNLGGEVVVASGNWWGDPAGPNGPLGDGVSGAVSYDPARTTPFVPGSAFGYSILIRPHRGGPPALHTFRSNQE